MAWSCGIVGLPNAGKSTMFKALTALDVTIEKYPFSTIDPNKAVVPLPDPRLTGLAEICQSKKVTPATIEIFDVAGLVKGASRGEGLGNQFLGHLRDVDLLIHVVAGFDLVSGDQETPVSRLETVNLELCLADLEMVARKRQKVEPRLKSGDKNAPQELAVLSRLEEHLNRGAFISKLNLSKDEKLVTEQLALLTLKEMIYVYNLNEESFLNPDTSFFPSGSPVLPICANLEAELTELPEEDRSAFLEAYGIAESRTAQLLRECYSHLELSTFYTVKGDEARAWVVPSGIRAVEAAGKVHTDMASGFINVEVITWEMLLAEGSLPRAREKGLARVEGRDYPVKDGEVLFFRFRH